MKLPLTQCDRSEQVFRFYPQREYFIVNKDVRLRVFWCYSSRFKMLWVTFEFKRTYINQKLDGFFTITCKSSEAKAPSTLGLHKVMRYYVNVKGFSRNDDLEVPIRLTFVPVHSKVDKMLLASDRFCYRNFLNIFNLV